MSSVEVFILSLFDMTMYVTLFNSICRVKKIKILQIVAYIIIGALLLAFIDYKFSSSILNRTISTAGLFIWFTTYSYRYLKSVKSLITSFSFITVMLFTLQFLSIIILTLILGQIEFLFIYGLIAQSIGLAILLLIVRFLPMNSFFSYIDQKNAWVQIVLINMFMIYFIMSILWTMNIHMILQYLLMVFIILLFILFVNIFLLKSGFVNLKNKEKLEIFETYVPIINSVIEEVKIKQHDYHNQLQTINKLKEQISSDSHEYLDDLVKPDIWSKLILLENKVLMAFFYSKYSYTKEKNIELEYDISNFLIDSKYTDYELIEMYGILIDNAVEAVEGLESKEKRTIKVKISWDNNMNVFVVSNSVINFSESDIQKMFESKHTSKGTGRGIGLTKLRQLLKKYKGNLTANYDTNYELVEVAINHC